MKELSKGEIWRGKLLYSLLRLIGYLPSWWHYGMSWCISYLLQYVIGYRRKVVQTNLANSFPEKSKAELRKLERAFYHHLCNVGVETVMLAAFGERRFRRHVSIENPELIEELHKENKRIFFLLGHYGNWEWYTGCQLLLPVTEFNVAFVRQKGAWHYVLSKLRSKFGAQLMDKWDAAKIILHQRNDKSNKTYIMVADQAPGIEGAELFVNFLNQYTAVVTGMDRLAKMLGAAVVYVDVERPKLGKYRLKLVEMTRDASQLPKHQLSKDFMQLLEKTIRRKPEIWLWSHKRWKVTPELVKERFPHKDIEMA